MRENHSKKSLSNMRVVSGRGARFGNDRACSLIGNSLLEPFLDWSDP
jgi:hypothetical protein